MNFKKNGPIILITIVSLVLGTLALLTALKLRQEKPIAPTAPESQPKAIEGTPVPECRLTFTITLASPSPAVSPTPPPQCGTSCVSNAGCPTSLTCYNGVCRAPACPTETDCVCNPSPTPTSIPSPSPTPSATPLPSPTPTQTPGTGGGSPSPNPTPSPSPTPSATPLPSPTPTSPPECNITCTSNTQCPVNMICYITSGNTSGNCRTPSCATDSDCVCNIQPSASPSPTPSVTPTVPKAGTSWPTVFMIVGGVALLILGLAVL